MLETDKAWLAGIIDGEGSIFIMKQRRKDRERDTNYILRMSVDSTDPYMAVECLRIAGGVKLQESSDKRPNCSDRLKWQMNGNKATKLLKEILPYMRVKFKQAHLAIEFQESTKKHWKHMQAEDYSKQEVLYQALKDAKQELKIGKHPSLGV